MPTPGEVVIYSEGAKEFLAIVFEERIEPDHQGADGEPCLHLVYFDPDTPVVFGKIRAQDKIQMRFDVVHESHSYSEDYLRIHGPQAHAGQGRWREIGAQRTFPTVPGAKAAKQSPGSTLRGWGPGAMMAPGSGKGR
jgi:hypothetical protein